MIKTALLKNIFLFHELDEKSLEYLAAKSRVTEINKNKILFSEGDKANTIFIIIRGKVKIYNISSDGVEHIIHIHKEGDIIAEAAVFDSGIYPANCLALEDTKMIHLSKEVIITLIKKQPETALKFMASYSKRLRQFVKKVEELSNDDIKTRLVNYLIKNMYKEGNNYICKITGTKKNLASLIGTIPETLSRNLDKLKKENLISVEKNIVIIKNFKKLKNILDS